MKKCAIYCTLCILIGGYFLLRDKAVEMPIDQVAQYDIINTESEPPNVSSVDDVLNVLNILNEASDIHITYTHSLLMDGISHEMEYAGSTYNYDVDRGHTSVINDKLSAELWYTEDKYKVSTELVEDMDLAYTSTKDCYKSNLQTIRLICEMVTQGKVQNVIKRDHYTVYKASSDEQMANTDMLHVTVDSVVEHSNWMVIVPDDSSGEYAAILDVYPSENKAGITRERFSYKFKVNTGFRCTFPDQ